MLSGREECGGQWPPCALWKRMTRLNEPSFEAQSQPHDWTGHSRSMDSLRENSGEEGRAADYVWIIWEICSC